MCGVGHSVLSISLWKVNLKKKTIKIFAIFRKINSEFIIKYIRLYSIDFSFFAITKSTLEKQISTNTHFIKVSLKHLFMYKIKFYSDENFHWDNFFF